MRVYKVVPCVGRLFAKNESEIGSQISDLSNVILQESVGGWSLLTSIPVVVSTKKSKRHPVDCPYNALVFAKDVIKEGALDKPEKSDEE